ncbi:MAG TPA: hypothetical protein VMG60_05800 [Burkholderiaceae bacterium]|nr:hypothetical protein [Burkholderiaceae bacterium]
MDYEVSKRWLFAFSAGIVLVIVALIYLLFAVHRPEAQRNSSEARRASPGRSPSSPVVAPTAADASALAEIGPDETILCGYGRVKAEEAEKIRNEASHAADKVLDRVKARLAASGDPREVALALYMNGSTDVLVARASGSGDPRLYALAFLACSYDTVGTCAVLSAQQWADIEPDNGIPWLFLAAAAGSDTDARNRAVIRASAARNFDPHLPDFLAMLRWPELRDQPPQTRSALANQLMGMQTSLPTITYAPFIQFCRDPSVGYATRTSACSNLTDLLVKDRTLLGFSTGVKLSEFAGWPSERVTALREKKAVYQSALAAAESRADRGSSDCEDLAAFDQRAADYSRLGETGVALKYLDEARARPDTAKRLR